MLSDLRYALRRFYRAPAFTLFVIAMMTAGLSISIYIASLVNTLVFKPLPFAQSERVVVVDKALNGMRLTGGEILASDLLEIDEKNQSFATLLFYEYVGLTLNKGSTSKRLQGLKVDPGLFELTQALPVLGRTLQKCDIEHKAPPNVVISYRLWKTHFSFDKYVIGKKINVNNQFITVVGVMPEGYRFPLNIDIWYAFDRSLIERGKFTYLGAIAKLKANVSTAMANQDVSAIMSEISRFHYHPETQSDVGIYVETLPKQALGQQGIIAVYALSVGALLLLLLSAINVGSLLFSKALERTNDIAIRRAVGAPRYRLIMLMLWESIIVCFISGALALLIVSWTLTYTHSIISTFIDSQFLYWWIFSIDSTLLLITLAFVLSTFFIAGVLPSFKATSGHFSNILHIGARGAINYRIGKLSSVLIKVEVALSTMVLIVSFMFVFNTLQSNHALHQFNKSKLLSISLELPLGPFQLPNVRAEALRELEQKIEALENVTNVAIGSSMPGQLAWVSEVNVVGRAKDSAPVYANTVFVSQDLFSLLNIEPIIGRLFEPSDQSDTQGVVVISDLLAQRLWPGESPIGKRIEYHAWLKVIGVIKDIEHGNILSATADEGGIYLLNNQFNTLSNQVMVAFSGDQEAMIKQINSTLFELDPDNAAFNIMPYEQVLGNNMLQLMLGSQLFVLIALVALILVGLGIYGVTANGIRQRLREIGVRRALGATKRQLVIHFIGQVSRQLLLSLISGVVLAYVICYLFLADFVMTTPLMLALFLAVVVLFMGVICIAVTVPLLKVLKHNPAYALRAE
ncbi:hypothetical protein CW745_04410 [Psychromonas sp. psych-6C06]|uniref:ABC transporter permease n=1 Tax=Psychromonas sp. psych-6C06 TaxID=2058089 RepID=UPI000C323337|nr:ABC transporter permease [Psychromonas sp. psych-6C06]PKF62672.1 hypothetical protein CW745_04410 [Psychromonas sp. psych-6C06]